MRRESQKIAGSYSAASPRVSVCMSMHNASQYLCECLESVLGQTFEDFEFLIVDDGSSDNSAEIVKSYHDDRIRLLQTTHDRIGSLNMLLNEARGGYVACMDAAYVMCNNRLAIQYDFLEKEKDIDIICGEYAEKWRREKYLSAQG